MFAIPSYKVIDAINTCIGKMGFIGRGARWNSQFLAVSNRKIFNFDGL